MCICHNPYFSRWFSAIGDNGNFVPHWVKVTILILVDGFLQLDDLVDHVWSLKRHNPYFSRWFSAIKSP